MRKLPRISPTQLLMLITTLRALLIYDTTSFFSYPAWLVQQVGNFVRFDHHGRLIAIIKVGHVAWSSPILILWILVLIVIWGTSMQELRLSAAVNLCMSWHKLLCLRIVVCWRVFRRIIQIYFYRVHRCENCRSRLHVQTYPRKVFLFLLYGSLTTFYRNFWRRTFPISSTSKTTDTSTKIIDTSLFNLLLHLVGLLLHSTHFSYLGRRYKSWRWFNDLLALLSSCCGILLQRRGIWIQKGVNKSLSFVDELQLILLIPCYNAPLRATSRLLRLLNLLKFCGVLVVVPCKIWLWVLRVESFASWNGSIGIVV